MARNSIHTPAKPKADIAFENERRNAANELRGDDDGVPFEEKVKLLTIELAAQFEESTKFEKRIQESLKCLNLDSPDL